jgi:4-amino-4-deoxy-L-arabinose transferase-like glycosyltransferase
MEKYSPTWITLLVILLVAAALRLHGIDWDDGIGAHPDERYIIGVAEKLSWPGQLNPFECAADYAYGHLPLYLLAVTSGLVRGGDPLILGRVLAGLLDVGTVAVTFELGRQAYDEGVGLLAAGFVALSVLHVQQAHFYTSDVLLAFLVLGMLVFAVRLVQGGRARDAWLTGAWAGLALGTKASAALLVVPLSAAVSLAPSKRRYCVWRCGVAGITVFALTSPFALIELPTFWQNVARQAAISRGTLDVPYTLQYHATWPYIYLIVQQWRWGMGCLPALTAFGGLAYAVGRAVQSPPRPAEWVIMAWVLPSFAFVGGLYAKFPRYLLPVAPLFAIYAALLVADLTGLDRVPAGVSRALLLGSMLFRCLILASVYGVPHPWVRVSEWFYENVDRGTVVATEEWDHTLPLDTTGYDVRVLPVFEEETPEKWETVETALAEAEYMVIASRRAYATLPRLSKRYPLTARYYERLFDGNLGFEPVACFSRVPRLGPFALVDDPTSGLAFNLPELCRVERHGMFRLRRLDESFVVYDHPQVLVFKASE